MAEDLPPQNIMFSFYMKIEGQGNANLCFRERVHCIFCPQMSLESKDNFVLFNPMQTEECSSNL